MDGRKDGLNIVQSLLITWDRDMRIAKFLKWSQFLRPSHPEFIFGFFFLRWNFTKYIYIYLIVCGGNTQLARYTAFMRILG